jgi:hypothetical protein
MEFREQYEAKINPQFDVRSALSLLFHSQHKRDENVQSQSLFFISFTFPFESISPISHSLSFHLFDDPRNNSHLNETIVIHGKNTCNDFAASSVL